MPQELQVLTCYQCETFQVQIVKKVPKWQCKMCGEKQSVKKVYFIGSGKECREIVQDLNTKRIQLEEKRSFHNLTIDQDNLINDSNSKDESGMSKWSIFVQESKVEDHFNDPEEKYTFERKPVKRKKKVQTKEACSYQDDLKREVPYSKQAKYVSYECDKGSDVENNYKSPQMSTSFKSANCRSKHTEVKISKWDDDEGNDDINDNNGETDFAGIYKFKELNQGATLFTTNKLNNSRNTQVKDNKLINSIDSHLYIKRTQIISEFDKTSNETKSAKTDICHSVNKKSDKRLKYLFDDDDNDLDLNI